MTITISKLPIRQITKDGLIQDFLDISKLPIRQITACDA